MILDPFSNEVCKEAAVVLFKRIPFDRVNRTLVPRDYYFVCYLVIKKNELLNGGRCERTSAWYSPKKL